MKIIAEPETLPVIGAFPFRITYGHRSTEADGWDLHVSKNYVGIDGVVGEDRVMSAGGRVPDSSEPVAAKRSSESALFRQLRDEVRKRHYLKLHLEDVRVHFDKDLKEGCGYVRLPKALGRKYPNADHAWGW